MHGQCGHRLDGKRKRQLYGSAASGPVLIYGRHTGLFVISNYQREHKVTALLTEKGFMSLEVNWMVMDTCLGREIPMEFLCWKPGQVVTGCSGLSQCREGK